MPGTSGLSGIQKSWANGQTLLFLYQQILGEKKIQLTDKLFIAELQLPFSDSRPVSSVQASLKCHVGFQRCCMGCPFRGMGLQAEQALG